MKLGLRAAVVALSFVVSIPNVFASKNSEVTTQEFVEISTGKIMGYTYDGVSTFKGIPYATADRFEMPKKAEPWQGIKSTLVFGEVAPQNKTLMSQLNVVDSVMETVENEDRCLNLNVWTADMDPTAKKPVIFWLHGGGFSSGSSNEIQFYTGDNMAKTQDVVFVSVNHRLNYLGYMDLSAYGEKYKYSGNAGMADIVMALEWVKENIEKFGGDPNNVTIEGQSGGGSKVTTLMGMPAAKGLFHKAMIQSGGSVLTTRTTEMAQAETAKVLEILGITPDNIDELQNIPYVDLYAAASKAGVRVGPVVDGDYYPTGTFDMSADIPVLVGTVFSEFGSNFGLVLPYPSSEEGVRANSVNLMTEADVNKAYEAKFGDKAEEVKAAFVKAYPDHNLADGLYIANRSIFSPISISEKMEELGGVAYQYVQGYNYPAFGGITPVHTYGDIPF